MERHVLHFPDGHIKEKSFRTVSSSFIVVESVCLGVDEQVS
jgi:hypothetical protein